MTGQIIEGYYVNGELEGFGTFSVASVHEGYFKKSKKEGFGYSEIPGVRKYLGNWE